MQVGGGIRTLVDGATLSRSRRLPRRAWHGGFDGPHIARRRPAASFRRRILLGLDARDGKVAVKGWTSVSETTAIDLLKELSGYAVGAVIYTDIARDGMLGGPNLSALREVVELFLVPRHRLRRDFSH